MKIYFNRKVRRSPWGGGAHFMSSLVDALESRGHDVVFTFQNDIDVIFMMDPRYEEDGSSIREIYHHKLKNPNTKIVHRINECDARKNTNDIDMLLMSANSIADKTIFISEWLKNYFQKKGFRKECDVIYNGCNTKNFFPIHNKESVSTPLKIVTHHWSDNWLKGFDAYKLIDELCLKYPQRYQFTYIGRYAKEYQPQATTIINPLYGKELGDELRKHDVYVTASRFEPCGMHHIEGAASGLPVLYHKDGGGIVESCEKHGLSFSSADELVEQMNALSNDYQNFVSKIDYSFLSMERCLSSYIQIIESLK